MGNNSPSQKDKIRQITELPGLQFQNDENQQFIQKDQCCWIQFSKVSIQKLTWEKNILIKLKQIRKDKSLQYNWQWVDQLITFLQKGTKVYSRIPFIKQINEIKYAKSVRLVVDQQQKQTLLSPCEVQQFKTNLKKSVLISFPQVKQNSPRPMGYTSFAGSNIIINNNRQQIQLPLNRMTYKNQNTNVVKSMMTTKKNKIEKNMYAEHFRKSILKQGSQVSSRSNLRGSVMSFVDDTIASMLKNNHLNQISKQSACLLQCFVKLTMIIESHIRNQSFIFAKIKEIYAKNLVKNFSSFTQKQQLQQQTLQNCINSIKLFISLMTDGIYDFYNLSSFRNPMTQSYEKDQSKYLNPLIANEQNILALVTALIFKDDQIYNVLFSLVQKYNLQKQKKFEAILKGHQKIGPQYFQIKPQYCLNNLTIRSFMKQQSISVGSKMQNLQVSDLQSENESSNKEKTPYKQCIVSLKKLQKTKTPISKLKVIMECAELITKSIQKFYSKNSMQMDTQVLDADQILSIFCYLVVKSQIKDIHSHMFILEHFSTDHQLISVTGYYYSVLTCAIQQLQKNVQRSLQAHLSQHNQSSQGSIVTDAKDKFLNLIEDQQKKAHISKIINDIQEQNKMA